MASPPGVPKEEATGMFIEPTLGLATLASGPNQTDSSSSIEERITHLSNKMEEMEIREGRKYEKVESELSNMTYLLEKQMNMTEKMMDVKAGEDMEGAAGAGSAGSARDTEVSAASAARWAADHHPNLVRFLKDGGRAGRDGGKRGSSQTKDNPESPEGSSGSSGSESDGGEPSWRRKGRKGDDNDPGSGPDSSGSDTEDRSSSEDDDRRRTRRETKRDDRKTQGKKRYESRSSVRKIIKDEFRASIDKIGDPKFALYKKNWAAMSRDYRIREKHLVRFMNRLFDGDVLLVYQNVRDEHPSALAKEIWKKMSVVCYNSNHQAAVRDKVFRPRYEPKSQTVEEYGNAIKTAALALGYGIPERQLIDQFEQGLPSTLEKHVTGLSGTFDEIVAMTAKYERACKRGSESLRRVGEGDGDEEGNYLTIDGRRVRRRPGVLCYRRNCKVNGGRDHFARDHKETPTPGPGPAAGPAAATHTPTGAGNVSGAGNGQSAPNTSQ